MFSGVSHITGILCLASAVWCRNCFDTSRSDYHWPTDDAEEAGRCCDWHLCYDCRIRTCFQIILHWIAEFSRRGKSETKLTSWCWVSFHHISLGSDGLVYSSVRCLSEAQVNLHKSLKTGYHFNSFIHTAWISIPSLERHRRCLSGSTIWNLCLRFTVLWDVTSCNFVGRYQCCSGTHLPSCLVSHFEDVTLLSPPRKQKI